MYIESLEDFRRRLQNTFIFVKIKDEEHLVYFKDIDEDGKLVLKSSKFGTINVVRDSYPIKYHFPKRGVYNINGEACYFVRLAARQWKRALCKANTSIVPLLEYLGPIMREHPHFSENNIEQLYYPWYPKSLDEGLSLLKVSLAINKSIAISLGITKEKPLLWYENTVIGFLNPASKTIELKCPLFLEELKDNLKLIGQSWQIIQ